MRPFLKRKDLFSMPKFHIRKKIFRSNVLRSIYLSYMTICLVVLLIGIPVSLIINHKANKQSKQVDYYILSEFKNYTDNFLDQQSSAVEEIAFSDNISAVELSSNLSDVDYYNLSSFTTYLSNLKGKYSCIDTLGFYSRAHNKVVCNYGVYDAVRFFNSYISINNTDYQDWISDINSSKNYFEINGSLGKKLFYRLSGERLYNFPIDYVIFASFNAQKITQQINKILDSTGNMILFHNSNDGISLVPDTVKTSDNLQSKSTLSNTSDVTNLWKMDLVPDKSFYNRPIRQITYLTVSSLFLQLIFLLVLTVYYSRKQYQPLRSLAFSLSNENNTIGDIMDEYSFIYSKLQTLTAENSHNQILIEHQTIHNIIYKHASAEDIELFDKCFQRSKNPYYSLILIAPDKGDIDMLISQGYTNLNIQLIFTNIIEEVLCTSYIAKVFCINSYFCCVISSAKKDSDNLIQLLSTAQRLIDQYYSIHFCAATSPFETEIGQMYDCYNNAKKNIGLLEVLGTNSITQFEEFEELLNNTPDLFTINAKNKILNFINANEPEKAYETFTECVNNVLTNTKTANIVEHLTMNLISIFTYILANILSEDDIISYNKYNPVNCILPFNTIQELKENAKNYISVLCNYLYGDYTVTREQPSEIAITKYINENFCNPDFNANNVCEHFNITPSALSMLFKRIYKVGTLDYITTLRIDRAKYYLESTSKKIDEISVLVGYSNTRSFSRAFKRVEGVTPGQYRKDNQI